MKRMIFEEILESEFRWPKEGDVPFIASDDFEANANIAEDDFSRMVYMMNGYKKAADLMVIQAQADTVERHYLVYPIIFNYRQFIELSLKYIIATYGSTVSIGPVWSTHDLIELWRIFIELLERFGSGCIPFA